MAYMAYLVLNSEITVTPIPDADESRDSSVYQSGSVKSRNNLHTGSGLPSSSARSSVDPRRS